MSNYTVTVEQKIDIVINNYATIPQKSDHEIIKELLRGRQLQLYFGVVGMNRHYSVATRNNNKIMSIKKKIKQGD